MTRIPIESGDIGQILAVLVTTATVLFLMCGRLRAPYNRWTRNAAVAVIGKKKHELDGPIAFAAWLGVHALLMTGVRGRIEAFIDWSWNYFSKTRPIQILDRTDEAHIDWNQGVQGENPSASPTAR